MSYSYFLTCLDCGRSIHLGKTIGVEYSGIEGVKTGFAMLGGNNVSGWQPSKEVVEELQHFLFVHRGHELCVVPETVNNRAPEIEFAFPTDDETSDPLFNRSSFFAQDVTKADAEDDQLADDVILRLKNSSPT